MKNINAEPIKVVLYDDKFKVNLFTYVSKGKRVLYALEHITKKTQYDNEEPYEISEVIPGVELGENEFVLADWDEGDEFMYPVLQFVKQSTRGVKVNGKLRVIVEMKPELL